MPAFKGDVRPLEVQLDEYIRVNLSNIDAKIGEVYRRIAELEARRTLLREIQAKFIDLKKVETNG